MTKAEKAKQDALEAKADLGAAFVAALLTVPQHTQYSHHLHVARSARTGTWHVSVQSAMGGSSMQNDATRTLETALLRAGNP